ncbi:oligogalacturonate lyase family protein [Gracilibacillus dipsosauri]|uniref:Oligogalacturonide lyase n=1 Tax=Gracilibacillus dipsosauri TaxID=178340 RepID=A0A317L2A4_9BACI|nr:oligogalacturonate lyase family protein [Gracilibacillus dipsosauri]PWU67919.1 oligogalacturonide lyase [Gracilibacillus dipsosauri]
MGKGKEWQPEWRKFQDRITGISTLQLTSYTGHSHHFYFTENGWYDEGRKLLFCSDRNNKTDLFSICIETGVITQLTDHDKTYEGLSPCLHPDETRVYFRKDQQIIELDLNTLKEKVIYEELSSWLGGNLNCTADGKYLITCKREDLSDKVYTDLGNGYIGHRALMEARPKSQIIKISLETNEVTVVYQEDNFITHINTSPTKKELITFCHEGPWNLVDHRIWVLNIESLDVWKIRERKEEDEMIGHEYWYQDGETIGYHGFRQDRTGFFGKIKYDHTEEEEVEFNFVNWHAFSNDFSKIVVDGRAPLKNIIIWYKNEDGFSKPKVLCEHRCSFHVQKVHAHPRFTPDGKKLLYTSDRNGYANLYLVDVPDDANELPDYV